MEFRFSKEPIDQIQADLVFVLTFEKEGEQPIPTSLQQSDGGFDLDHLFGGGISKAIKTQQFTGKEGETIHFSTFGKIKAKNLLVVGAGLAKNLSLETYRRLGGKVAQVANHIKASSVAAIAEPIRIKGFSSAERLQALVEGAILASYNFDQFKQKEKRIPKTLKNFIFQTKGSPIPLEKACWVGEVMAEASNLTRDLTNRPSNDVTPTILAKTALSLAKQYKNISCRVLSSKEIKKEKMGALLAVTKGSNEEPSFIHLRYKPSQKTKTKVALVGKGITFDSGGLNIKTKEQELMKFDMAGAATVLGVFKALANLKPKVEVDGLIAACENMPSGSATRPGDIITTRSGKTVEVINTDAEGRLVLADALDYACELKPTYMIDMATLTGGAAYALGELWTPILGNDKHLVERLLNAGKKVGEPAWELPIIPEYKKGYLKGPADLKNSGSGTKASTISGALFLEEFVRKNKWAHMDIASSAWADEPYNYYTMVGATGIPVRTILYFLMGL